jgi:protein O-GlcNAc transferase
MSPGADQHRLHAALSLHQAGNLDGAGEIYREILRNDPHNSQALHYLGVIEASGGNLAKAKSLIARSLQQQPANIQFLENYATILFQAQEYASALEVCRQGLRASPNGVPLLYVGAVALYKLKRFDESVEQFDELLARAPNHIAAINERGSVLAELKRYEAALSSFQKALALQPRYVGAHLNSGNLYAAMRRYEDALGAFHTALSLDPALADAWLGRGNVYTELKQYDEAFAAYDRALSLKPELAEAWLGRGNAYVQLRQYDNAFAAYDRALSLKPDLAEAWLGRGNAYVQLKQYDNAFAAYDRALSLKPDVKHAEGFRLYAMMHLCDWGNIDAQVQHLLSAIRDQKLAINPFVLLPIAASPLDQLQCAKAFVADQGSLPVLRRDETYSHDRIRVAYLSADFREHATAYLAAGLFEQHDRSRFEVTGISFGPEDHSAMRRRLIRAFEHFVDAENKGDGEIADLIRRREIDIVIDLNGFTQGGRWNVLAQRPAPVQINYLGYPGTMGAEYIDYIVADRFVIPDVERQFYREKVIYLAHTFQANDSKRKMGERIPSRAEAGLPENAFVFCAFNNSYKILPEVFDVWMRLLRKVAGSVLWLVADSPAVENNLRKEAENRSVEPARLIFAPRIPYSDYLARYRLADLFLDTLPFNAGTTASDALWAGLPLITCPGRTFASRMAGSLLTAIEMPELIAESMADYEALAAKLACDPRLMAATRMKLDRNRLSAPLFDAKLFTRDIETAYAAIWQRAQIGLPPDHIVVPQ